MKDMINEPKNSNLEKLVPYQFDGFYENLISFSQKGSEKLEEMTLRKFFYERIGNRKLATSSYPATNTFSLDEEEYIFTCPSDMGEIFRTAIFLFANGVPRHSIWYLYDKSWKDTTDYYSFFVVCGGNILLPHIMLSKDAISKGRSLEFLKNTFDPDWDKPSHIEAVARWYYNKFYFETTQGQIHKLQEQIENDELSSDASKTFINEIAKDLKKANVLLLAIAFFLFLKLFK